MLKLDVHPFIHSCKELSYNISEQRFQILRTVLRRGIRLEQFVAYESKRRREGLSPQERGEILSNLYPCMHCRDPVYVKPDPSLQGEGGVNYYAICENCKTPIGRLLRKIKVYFQSRFR